MDTLAVLDFGKTNIMLPTIDDALLWHREERAAPVRLDLDRAAPADLPGRAAYAGRWRRLAAAP